MCEKFVKGTKIQIIKDNRDPCQFCGKQKWRVLIRIFENIEREPSKFEKMIDKIKELIPTP